MFGLPARHVGQQRFSGGRDEILGAVPSAFRSLNWRILSESDGRCEAHAPFSISSWGERVRVEVEDDGIVRVSSKCIHLLQFFDWGKNLMNVSEFLAQLRKEMLASKRSRPRMDRKGNGAGESHG